VLCVISLACSSLSGLVPTPGEEAGQPGAEQGETPVEAGEAPAVLGFVLDPDGAPVAYATVGDEYTDRSGAVSGDLTGSASGWLEVNAPGYATGYEKPGEGIGKTAIFEARLTPFEVFLSLESGKEVVFTLGDAAQPVAEVRIPDGAASTLPAYVEAVTYDLVDVGPYLAELSSGEKMDLEFAVAVEASSDSGDPIALAAGESISVTVFPNPTLPASPTLAVFDPEAGVWQVHEGACMPAEAGGVPQFAPLIGLFGPHVDPTSAAPHDAMASMSPGGRGLYRQTPPGDDQAYQDAMTDCEVWLWIGEGQIDRTGSVSPEWEAEMTNRVGKLADAAEAYADTHPDSSGLSHLLAAAQLALKTGQDPAIADKLMKDAREIAEAAAEALLEEGDCGHIVEILLAEQQLILLGGSQAIIDALQQKLQQMGDCDEWTGYISVYFTVAPTPPRLSDWQRQGGGDWREEHVVHIVTNVQTHILNGEDFVTLHFPEVRYVKKDRHGCETWLDHVGPGEGKLALKFDGTYDGYTFAVGGLSAESSSATIMYVAHGENWNSEEEKCEVISEAEGEVPTYTSILVHGMSGTPPITMQQILQSGNNLSKFGKLQLTNDAFALGIYPWQNGSMYWNIEHVRKYLPVK
jgi:hypothetical protein